MSDFDPPVPLKEFDDPESVLACFRVKGRKNSRRALEQRLLWLVGCGPDSHRKEIKSTLTVLRGLGGLPLSVEEARKKYERKEKEVVEK